MFHMTRATAAGRGSIVPGAGGMEYDQDKVDEMVSLAKTPSGRKIRSRSTVHQDDQWFWSDSWGEWIVVPE